MQEEIDWECYGLYGLIGSAELLDLRSDDPPPVQPGQRAFEIVLARRVAAGEEETSWFERHGSAPVTDIPIEWPEAYRQVVQRRIERIESDRNIALIERPECKRRWNREPWDELERKALREWLLNRLESYFDLDGRMNGAGAVTAAGPLRAPRLFSVGRVADLARQDREFRQVAALYAKRPDFDLARLVGELVAAESVPALPVLRYKATGLDKRAAWERTWELQRREDAVAALFDLERLRAVPAGQAETALRPLVAALALPEGVREKVLHEAVEAVLYLAEAQRQRRDLASPAVRHPVTEAAERARRLAVGDIPVPPRYTSADFLANDFWRLRGKLDVPKERWVSFPHAEGADGALLVAWAGYDHLQLARAIAERFEQAKEREGRRPVPLLAALAQQLPWLKQWHNELDPEYGTRMGEYFADYLAEEAKALGMSVEQAAAWRPENAKSFNTKARRTRKD